MKTLDWVRSILITGGTGSFGHEMVKYLLTHCPHIQKIILLSRDEFKQFEMAQRFSEYHERLRFFLGDVRDKDRLLRAFKGVDVVLHAAALKQVPACEYNPFEAIKTNVLGAQNIVEAAIDCGVKRVVALSTDKACSPINLYGATKLCSDKLFIAGNVYSGVTDTRFSVVRYGNVAGSRGSVIPFFRSLIETGADSLPITDTAMTRFWLRLPDAVKLVHHALDTMVGGELYVKKIPSIRVVDLATAMAPHLPQHVIGIRPGEKIHEMMISHDDARHTLSFDSHYIIQPDFDWWRSHDAHPDGVPVDPDFVYHSGNNLDWLSVADIQTMLSDSLVTHAN